MKKKLMFIRVDISIERKRYHHPQNIVMPIQIGYMISLLKNKYQIAFIDTRITKYSQERLIEDTLEFKPDYIVLSFTSDAVAAALNYAVQLKSQLPQAKIICIGPHASTMPETLILGGSGVDFVLRGECELDLVRFLKLLQSPGDLSKLGSLYYKGKTVSEIALVEDLDILPFPVAHRFFDLGQYSSIYPLRFNKKVKWGYILTSRGCNHSCIFCSPNVRTSYGKKVRFRSIDNVLQEMQFLKNLGVNVISFEDDNFTASKNQTMQLCEAILKSELKMKWIAHARIDELSKALMITMKKAGCLLLKVGVESGSNRIISILKKSRSWIDWNKKSQSIFQDAHEIGLVMHALFILGNPEETMEDIKQTIHLIKRIKPETIQLHFFVPYPGSKAFKLYCPDKRFDSSLHHYNDTNLVTVSKLTVNKLREIQQGIYRSFYLQPPYIINHLFRYGKFHIHNPGVMIQDIKGLL